MPHCSAEWVWKRGGITSLVRHPPRTGSEWMNLSRGISMSAMVLTRYSLYSGSTRNLLGAHPLPPACLSPLRPSSLALPSTERRGARCSLTAEKKHTPGIEPCTFAWEPVSLSYFMSPIYPKKRMRGWVSAKANVL